MALVDDVSYLLQQTRNACPVMFDTQATETAAHLDYDAVFELQHFVQAVHLDTLLRQVGKQSRPAEQKLLLSQQLLVHIVPAPAPQSFTDVIFRGI